MTWHFTVYSYLYFLTGTVMLVTAWMNWRHRHTPGMTSLATAMFFVSIWSFAGAFELAAVELSGKKIFLTLEYATASIYANFFLLFALQYYRRSHWLTPPLLILFWLLPTLDIIVAFTNGRHGLIWSGITLGPSGSNLVFYQHGPVYYLSMLYQTVILTTAISIIILEAIRTQGRERKRAIYMAISLMLPFAASYLFVFLPEQTLGIDLLPIGFSIGGLLISWIAFEDMHQQVVIHTGELETAIQTLKTEIETRRQLETQLRENQDMLSVRLADQSHKLTGLYNLLLMAGQALETEVLLKQALDRIRDVLGSDAACFYCMEYDFLHLKSHHGLYANSQAALQNLPIDWLFFGFDVRADINTAHSPDLPSAIAQAGFGACMFKWASLPDKIPGVLGVLWKPPHDFAVEDIALFSAFADGLGIVLENSRLRQTVAENATQKERRRMARDLHDSVTQSLHSLVMSAETANHLRQTRPQAMEKPLLHLVESARQSLKEMRLLLYELQLASPHEAGLVNALLNRLDAVERRAGIETRLLVDDNACWPKSWDDDLYPMAIETLNNALKHARATQITVDLRGCVNNFEMRITDNGRGINTQDAPHNGGMGLRNLADRAKKLGGRLEIQSEVGKGTCVSLLIAWKNLKSWETPEHDAPH